MHQGCGKRFLFVLLLSVTGVARVDLSAQSADVNRRLDDQLKTYEVHFKKLMAARGLPYFEGKVTEQKLLRAMRVYGEDMFSGDGPGAALLFYHHEADTLHTWLLDRQKLLAHSHQRMTQDSLVTLNNTLKFALSIDNMLGLAKRNGKNELKKIKKYRLRTAACLQLLSGILLPPEVADALAGKRYLIIIPSLNISSIPYSMLTPWGSDGTLLDSLSFSFAHNFTQLFEEVEMKNYHITDHNRIGEIKTPLLAGSPAFADSCTQNLSKLPGAKEELIAVASLLKAKPRLDHDARKDSVVAKLPDADLVYLATHGWSDTDDPLHQSFIAFDQPGGCGNITPLEIQQLSLRKNPIVILSACQSGLGKVYEAGIVGLARGFLKTGARSVTMSLWDVNDQQTAVLMKLFMEELLKPHFFSPAEPWRQAVLRYKKEFSTDPLYWAAFQNFGMPYQLKFKVALH
jgi:hypothetical protein